MAQDPFKELLDPKSPTRVLIRVVGDEVDGRPHNLPVLIQAAEQAIKQACPYYRPCECGAGCFLCRSGDEGKPYRSKRTCASCPVSQISPAGLFVGNVRLHHKIRDNRSR